VSWGTAPISSQNPRASPFAGFSDFPVKVPNKECIFSHRLMTPFKAASQNCPMNKDRTKIHVQTAGVIEIPSKGILSEGQ
jgi:hypothetical protein